MDDCFCKPFLQNSSFEGPPLITISPPLWEACDGRTPDTQPGWFRASLPPSDGISYLGLADEGASWKEGVSQMLSSPMTVGFQYTFTIDLAITNYIDFNCIGLQIWGGFEGLYN